VDTKKIVLYALIIFIMYTIINSPDRAGELVKLGFKSVSDAAQGVGDFMTALVN
jgi:hypothetical protein